MRADMTPDITPDTKPRTLLIAAGGTGGHIFPGLAVAEAMRKRGWRVMWLGHPERMEGELVPRHAIALLPLRFAGLRGKGLHAWLKLPFALFSACLQARAALKQCRPDVVLGMGGYVAFPAGLMAKLSGVPLVIHEQNAVAGSANRHLAKLAHTVLAGFPGALHGAQVMGNPVRDDLLALADVSARYGQDSKAVDDAAPLRILVMGGSLGAQILNQVVPQALALLTQQHPQRPAPVVVHQTGAGHLDAVKAEYERLGIAAQCQAFMPDMAQAFARTDLLIARAGAMTVSEVAAAGVAALFVPLPHAIDDHQRANARFLVDCGSAWLQEQKDFTPQWLAQWLMKRTPPELLQMAQRARQHARPQAAQHIAEACGLAANKTVPAPPACGRGGPEGTGEARPNIKDAA